MYKINVLADSLKIHKWKFYLKIHKWNFHLWVFKKHPRARWIHTRNMNFDMSRWTLKKVINRTSVYRSMNVTSIDEFSNIPSGKQFRLCNIKFGIFRWTLRKSETALPSETLFERLVGLIKFLFTLTIHKWNPQLNCMFGSTFQIVVLLFYLMITYIVVLT